MIDFKKQISANRGFLSNRAGLIILCLIIIFVIIILASPEGSTTEVPQTTNDSFLDKTKIVLQSPEERFGCEDGKIENLSGTDLTKINTTFKVLDVSTNKVEYPLNKDEVKIEYCFRVANSSSELKGLWLTIKFLDKDKNVLAEADERITDIPGRRIKTVYGFKIVDTGLANQMTNVSVGKK